MSGSGSGKTAAKGRKAAPTLELSEVLLHSVAESSSDAIFVKDTEGRYIFINGAGARVIGKQSEDILGQQDTALFPHDAAVKMMVQDKGIVETAKSIMYENVLTLPSGVRIMQVHKGPLRNHQGQVIGIYGISRDITEQKQAEAALRESEQKFSKIFQDAPLLITLSEIDSGRLIEVNENFLRASGFARDEVIGRTVAEVGWNPEEQRSQLRQQFLENGRVEGMELILHRKDRSRLTCLYSGVPINIGGKPRLLSIAQDITERKRAEQALATSEEKYRFFMEHANDAVLIHSFDEKGDPGPFREVNDLACAWTGYSREELAFMTPRDLDAPENQAHIPQVIEKLKTKGYALFDTAWVKKDGGRLPVEISTRIMEIKDKTYIVSLARNATERKQAERELIASEERYRKLFESSPISLWEEDVSELQVSLAGLRSQGVRDIREHFRNHPQALSACISAVKVVSVNKATLDLYEAPDAATLLQGLSQVLTEQSIEAFRDIIVALFEGAHSYSCETINRTIPGRPIHVLLKWSLLSGAQGVRNRALVSIVDITERKQAEEALLMSEERFRSIYDHIGIGIALISRDMEILSMNPQMQKWFPHIDLAEHHICFRRFNIPPRDSACTYCPTVHTLKDGQVHSAVTNTPTPDGVRHFQIIATPLRSADGSIIASIEMVEDVTERMQAEAALHAREHQLAESQRIAHVGSWERNTKTGQVSWSDEMFRLLGIDPGKDAASFELLMDMVHPDDRGMLRNAARESIGENRPYSIDYRIVLRDGRVRTVHEQAEVFFYEQGDTVILSGTVQDVTERKRSEAALRESEKRLRTLIDAIPDMVFFKDLSGRHVIDNRASETIVGISPEMLRGKTAEDLMPPESAAVCRRNDEEVIRSGETIRCEEETKDPQGGKRVLDTIRVPLYDDEGEAIGLVGIVRDITERKQAEERLRESEDRFRSIFEHATDGIMIADPVRKQNIEANRSICAMLGYTREELLGLRVEDMHPKADLPRILELFDRQLRGEVSLAPDIPMFRKDGSIIYADINSTQVSLGGKVCLLGVFRNITERKKAVEALATREHQLAESQRIAHIGSWEHDLRSGGVFWSDELFRLLGLDPKEDPADFDMFFEMVHPDDRSALRSAIGRTLKEQRPFDMEYRFVLRNGTTRIIHAQAELKTDAEGELVILSGTAQDITERKQVEEKIRHNEQFIRGILDTVDEGFIVIDRDYRIVTANKAYCDQAGLPCDDVIGRNCFTISHRANRPCYEEGEECAVRAVFDTGKPHSVLHKHKDMEGNELFVETKAFPIVDASGNVTSAIETLNNITEKHLLEEERLKSQKLESIGTLAGGIAHDFNNLLQGIFGYISMAKLSADNRQELLTSLDEAEKALHLSVKLTNQLLTFSKGGKPVKRPIDIRTVITNAARFALSGSRSDYRIALPDRLRYADADDGQIAQVVQNIVLNADQAMPLGGTVTVSGRNVTLPGEGLPAQLAPGEYVEISIRDTGIGIPQEFQSKIFDPYFTTKEKGSGLGLATAYSIVRNHGGAILVRSDAGKGTTFLLYLPASAVVPEEPVAAGEPATDRRGRILVMDDEDIVRKIAGKLLEALGHEVDFATNGDETVAKYQDARASGTPFDIVILDLTVRGGMGGAEAAKVLREADSSAKLVMSSGYSDEAMMADYRQHGFCAFLKKPYSIDDLRFTLGPLLEEGAQRAASSS